MVVHKTTSLSVNDEAYLSIIKWKQITLLHLLDCLVYRTIHS